MAMETFKHLNQMPSQILINPVFNHFSLITGGATAEDTCRHEAQNRPENKRSSRHEFTNVKSSMKPSRQEFMKTTRIHLTSRLIHKLKTARNSLVTELIKLFVTYLNLAMIILTI